jgi:hypothetical protein
VPDPLNAIASLLVLQKSRVPTNERAALTALSAFTPGLLGLAVPFVAASAASKGRGGSLWNPGEAAAPGDDPGADAGPTRVTVPDVVGATTANPNPSFDTAKETLQTWDLVAARAEVYSDKPDGTLLSQSPAAGKTVPLYSTVTVAVSKQGPPPPPSDPDTEMAELKRIEGKVDQVLSKLPSGTEQASSTGAQNAGPAQTSSPGADPASGAAGRTAKTGQTT